MVSSIVTTWGSARGDSWGGGCGGGSGWAMVRIDWAAMNRSSNESMQAIVGGIQDFIQDFELQVKNDSAPALGGTSHFIHVRVFTTLHL